MPDAPVTSASRSTSTSSSLDSPPTAGLADTLRRALAPIDDAFAVSIEFVDPIVTRCRQPSVGCDTSEREYTLTGWNGAHDV
jgi:hypothetical protein